MQIYLGHEFLQYLPIINSQIIIAPTDLVPKPHKDIGRHTVIFSLLLCSTVLYGSYKHESFKLWSFSIVNLEEGTGIVNHNTSSLF